VIRPVFTALALILVLTPVAARARISPTVEAQERSVMDAVLGLLFAVLLIGVAEVFARWLLRTAGK